MTELNTENVDRIFADCMFRSHEEYEECKGKNLYLFVNSIQNPTSKKSDSIRNASRCTGTRSAKCFHNCQTDSFPEQAMEPLSFRRAPPKTGSYGPDFIQRRKSFACWE